MYQTIQPLYFKSYIINTYPSNLRSELYELVSVHTLNSWCLLYIIRDLFVDNYLIFVLTADILIFDCILNCLYNLSPI